MSALLVRFLLIAQMTLGRDFGSKYALLQAETNCKKKKKTNEAHELASQWI